MQILHVAKFAFFQVLGDVFVKTLFSHAGYWCGMLGQAGPPAQGHLDSDMATSSDLISDNVRFWAGGFRG